MLTVGHIGSLYHPDPFRKFVLACHNVRRKRKPHPENCTELAVPRRWTKSPSAKLATFVNHGELLEQDALPVLATCDFVYAMYPEVLRFQGFRRTSLPIKLSTYIQAQRPIFAHTPPDSGLAKLISKHGVGTVCSSLRDSDIQNAIRTILNGKIGRENFEAIRGDLMGPHQLQKLRYALQTPGFSGDPR